MGQATRPTTAHVALESIGSAASLFGGPSPPSAFFGGPKTPPRQPRMTPPATKVNSTNPPPPVVVPKPTPPSPLPAVNSPLPPKMIPTPSPPVNSSSPVRVEPAAPSSRLKGAPRTRSPAEELFGLGVAVPIQEDDDDVVEEDQKVKKEKENPKREPEQALKLPPKAATITTASPIVSTPSPDVKAIPSKITSPPTSPPSAPSTLAPETEGNRPKTVASPPLEHSPSQQPSLPPTPPPEVAPLPISPPPPLPPLPLPPPLTTAPRVVPTSAPAAPALPSMQAEKVPSPPALAAPKSNPPAVQLSQPVDQTSPRLRQVSHAFTRAPSPPQETVVAPTLSQPSVTSPPSANALLLPHAPPPPITTLSSPPVPKAMVAPPPPRAAAPLTAASLPQEVAPTVARIALPDPQPSHPSLPVATPPSAATPPAVAPAPRNGPPLNRQAAEVATPYSTPPVNRHYDPFMTPESAGTRSVHAASLSPSNLSNASPAASLQRDSRPASLYIPMTDSQPRLQGGNGSTWPFSKNEYGRPSIDSPTRSNVLTPSTINPAYGEYPEPSPTRSETLSQRGSSPAPDSRRSLSTATGRAYTTSTSRHVTPTDYSRKDGLSYTDSRSQAEPLLSRHVNNHSMGTHHLLSSHSRAARMSHSLDTPAAWLVLYFTFNLGLTLFNKLVLQGFPFPWTLTGIQMLAGTLGTQVALRQGFFTQARLTQQEGLIMIAFSGLYTINIAVSNLSLHLVTVPFHQVVRATTPIFTIGLSAVFFQKKYSRNTYLSLLPVVFGVGFATYGDYYFTTWGFILTLIGTLLAAMKTLVTNRIQVGRLKLHPLDLLIRMSPLAFVQCVLWGWLSGELGRVRSYSATDMTQSKMIALLMNGILAFGLNVVSFTANKKTSALTMTVAANVKQVLTVILAVLIFNLVLTRTNMFGITLTLLGGALYGRVEMIERAKASTSLSTTRMTMDPEKDRII